MGEMTESDTLDRLVGLSKMASNAAERGSVIQDLQDYRLELMGDADDVSLSDADKTKVAEIGGAVINGQVRDVWEARARYSTLADVMDETLNEMVGFDVEGRTLSSIKQDDMCEVIKHNFPDSADIFDVLDSYIDRQTIELKGAAPAVMDMLAAYIAAFDPKLIGVYDASSMVRPIETHGDFMDSDTRLRMRYLASAVSSEVMEGTNHHIYRMAKIDAQSDTDSPEQVMAKLTKVMKEKDGKLNFLDKVAIFGNQPYLPDDLEVDLDANRRFDEYHPSHDRDTKDWATEACNLGAAFLPFSPRGTGAEIATKFVYPVGLAQKLHEHPDPKALQRFVSALPKNSPVPEALGIDLGALASSGNDYDPYTNE